MTAALNVVRLSVNPIFHVLETNPPCCKRAIQRDMVGASVVSRSRRIESPTKAGCLPAITHIQDQTKHNPRDMKHERNAAEGTGRNTLVGSGMRIKQAEV